MVRSIGRQTRRISRGRQMRMTKAALHGAMGGVMLVATASGALAECARPGQSPNVLNLVPLASGTAISSIIATINAVNTSSLAQSTAFAASPGGTQQNVEGGGRWSRIVVGTDEVQADNRTTGSVLGVTGDPYDCRSTTKLDYIGTQAGMDIGRFRFDNGANFQWGFTAGYVEVDAKDKTPNVGTFSGDSQVPFAGVYLALSKGNFSFDAQIRGDYYSLQLNDIDNSLFNHPLTARGAALLANTSYRFDLANNWFLEPSAGIVLSRTDVDSLDVAGAIDLPVAVTPAPGFPGTVQVGSIDSALARLSLRFGTTIVTPTMAWQPFGTVSVFHEFADSVTTSVTDASASSFALGSIPMDATINTSRVGTIGHIGAGIAGVVLNTGWLGYVRGDYRFGDNFEGLSVNAGLRYQFEPRNVDGGLKDDGGPSKPYNWTGPYVGFNSGGAWGQQEWAFGPGSPLLTPDYRGYLVGGQIGYDIQVGHAVFGIEADYNWTNAEGGVSGPGCGFNNLFSCVAHVDNIGFLTGRLGFTDGRTLYYLKGGLAFGEVGVSVQNNHGGLSELYTFNELISSSSTQTGVAVGGGIEFAIDDRWSAKGEWLYYDLGSKSYLVQEPGVRADVETTGNIARVGINYRFGNRGGYADAHHEALK